MTVWDGLEMYTDASILQISVLCELLGAGHYQKNHLYSGGCQELGLQGHCYNILRQVLAARLDVLGGILSA